MAERIPNTIPEFNQYINSSNTYQLATRSDRTDPNWKTLGWVALNSSDWDDKCTYWHDTLYPKYSDPSQSTSIVKEEVRNFMKDFHTFGNPLLDIMAASPNSDTTDEKQMSFKKKSSHKKPEVHKDAIKEICYGQAKPLGGNRIDFGCSTAHDSKRKSVAETADGVLISFTRIDKAAANPALPKSPDECAHEKVFPGATFTLDAGSGNKGDTLVGYLQWNDSKHPARVGPAGDMFTITIL